MPKEAPIKRMRKGDKYMQAVLGRQALTHLCQSIKTSTYTVHETLCRKSVRKDEIKLTLDPAPTCRVCLVLLDRSKGAPRLKVGTVVPRRVRHLAARSHSNIIKV